jgi:hypothetical protein
MNSQEREQLAEWLEQLIDDQLAPDAMADLEWGSQEQETPEGCGSNADRTLSVVRV